jgi:hypothetical protein
MGMTLGFIRDVRDLKTFAKYIGVSMAIGGLVGGAAALISSFLSLH